MDENEALAALADVEVVPCLQAQLSDAKELLAACLAADIPATLDRAPRCHDGACGCAPKLELLARAEDLPRVAALLEDRWRGMLAREGTVDEEGLPTAPDAPGDEPPCPACGTAAPLEEGACSGCGLQLG
jgi:hypothetical protein